MQSEADATRKRKMRIGLLTYHWVPNFGANLQALSSYSLLSQMGHDVVVLNYRPRSLENLYVETVPPEQYEVHERFVRAHFPEGPVCQTEEEFQELCSAESFDVVVVGSDAVFRIRKRPKPKWDNEDVLFPNPFWLRWVGPNAPRKGALAASSVGTNFLSLPKAIRKGVTRALRNMDYVSVRDAWTKWMIVALTNGRCWPRVCPDPVSILGDVVVIPEELQMEAAANHKRYILLGPRKGLVSDEWAREFVEIAHGCHLKVFGLPAPEESTGLPVDHEIELPLSPLEWYAWIQHSAGFVGDRFHSVVCSVFNSVPFVSFDTSVGGRYFGLIRLRCASRIYDLCKRIGKTGQHVCWGESESLGPSRAFEMLLSGGPGQQWERYIPLAKRAFRQTAREVLYGKK